MATQGDTSVPGAVHADPFARMPRRSMLADEIYDILRESLVSRRFAPGSRLNLDQLARELHVSNTPIRQALARLESEGLVTKEPYRGFTVSQLLDSRTIAELYDFRMLIEPPTAARAARRCRPDALARLKSLCDPEEIGQLSVDSGDSDAMAGRDSDFHAAIAQVAGNSYIASSVVAVITQMRVYNVYHRDGYVDQTWEEHRAVLAAIEAGDPDAAMSAMRAHLTHGLDRLRNSTA